MAHAKRKPLITGEVVAVPHPADMHALQFVVRVTRYGNGRKLTRPKLLVDVATGKPFTSRVAASETLARWHHLSGEQARADMRKAATLRASDQTLDAMADALAPLYAQAAQARIDARARQEAEQARRDALVAQSSAIASRRVRKAAALVAQLSASATDTVRAATTTPKAERKRAPGTPRRKAVRLPDANATDTATLLVQLEARHMARLAALGVGVDAPEAPSADQVGAEVQAVLAATRYRESPRRNYAKRHGGTMPAHIADLNAGAPMPAGLEHL